MKIENNVKALPDPGRTGYHAQAVPSRTIQPGARLGARNFAALWRYRRLLYFFIWRDVRVRYKQTIIGAAWAVVKPLIAAGVFVVVFSRIVHVPSDGLPYVLFVLAGTVPWTYFSSAVSQSTLSLVDNSNLISKAAFPRAILPLATLLTGGVELSLSLLVLLMVSAVVRQPLRPTLLFAPLFLLAAMVAAAAIGLWLSALNARFRDVQNVVPFMIQVWLYATPVVYPLSLAHGKLALIMALNPMSGVVEGFRWSMFGHEALNLPTFAVSGAVTLLLLLTGAMYFSRVERQLADVL